MTPNQLLVQDLRDFASSIYTADAMSIADIKRELTPIFERHGRTLPSYLGATSGSSKIVKSEKYDLYTYIMYLAPSDMSGVGNVCPSASPGCRAACLVNSGRAIMDDGINRARISRTLLFYGARSIFLRWLTLEIRAAHKKYGSKLSVRLNGTSDLHPKMFGSVLKEFSSVPFYDYTKMSNRFGALDEYPNYHVTWSWADGQDWGHVKTLLSSHNIGVAVPFAQLSPSGRVVKNTKLPETFMGMPVFDGDQTDLRFLDRELGAPKTGPYIVGLRAKRTDKVSEQVACQTGFFVTL